MDVLGIIITALISGFVGGVLSSAMNLKQRRLFNCYTGESQKSSHFTHDTNDIFVEFQKARNALFKLGWEIVYEDRKSRANIDFMCERKMIWKLLYGETPYDEKIETNDIKDISHA